MNKYSSYKDSEINWLDQIPSNWKRSRIRLVGDLYGGLTGKKGDDFNNEENPSNKPFVPFTNIFNNTYISKDHFQLVSVKEGEKQNRVLKNDLFFLMSSESYEDLGKCSILLEDVEELYLNSFCKGYRIKDQRVYPLFLNYQLLGSLHKEMISIEGNGFTRINLRQDRLLDIPVFIPPHSEQKQIVAFLDDKTTKIDNLIEQKVKKIDLLKEKRKALINHVVTKGLNPYVELKDSGVEWIGEIPRHWELTRLKYYVSFDSGYSFKSGDYSDTGVSLIRIGSLYMNTLSLDRSPIYLPEDYLNDHSDFVVNKNDILISMTGTLGKRDYGYSILYDKDFPSLLNQRVGRIKLSNNKVNLTYLMYTLLSESFLNQLFSKPAGTKQGNLSSDDIIGNYLGLPSVEQQQQIVDYLDKQTKEIDDLIQLEQQKIELLKEYRQSLISEVVTGKVRVCEEDLSSKQINQA